MHRPLARNDPARRDRRAIPVDGVLRRRRHPRVAVQAQVVVRRPVVEHLPLHLRLRPGHPVMHVEERVLDLQQAGRIADQADLLVPVGVAQHRRPWWRSHRLVRRLLRQPPAARSAVQAAATAPPCPTQRLRSSQSLPPSTPSALIASPSASRLTSSSAGSSKPSAPILVSRHDRQRLLGRSALRTHQVPDDTQARSHRCSIHPPMDISGRFAPNRRSNDIRSSTAIRLSMPKSVNDKARSICCSGARGDRTHLLGQDLRHHLARLFRRAARQQRRQVDLPGLRHMAAPPAPRTAASPNAANAPAAPPSASARHPHALPARPAAPAAGQAPCATACAPPPSAKPAPSLTACSRLR